MKKKAVALEAGITPQYLSQLLAGEPGVTDKTKQAVLKAVITLAEKAAGRQLDVPDHPGVRELAADSELCLRHHVTVAELQELSSLVLLRQGRAVSLATKDEALQALQNPLTSPDVAMPQLASHPPRGQNR